MSSTAKPWIVSLLLHALFWGCFILSASQSETYALRGFWGLLPLPLLAFGASIFSLRALGKLKIAPLPRWQKLLIRMLHGPGLLFMLFLCLAFLTLVLSGTVGPSDYATYPSPSGRRSVTIASHNITCTHQVYLNRGLIMQSAGSFQIGTAKCLKNARAEIGWQPGETAIAWKYRDRQGLIQLPPSIEQPPPHRQ